jgi:hypothetical protein
VGQLRWPSLPADHRLAQVEAQHGAAQVPPVHDCPALIASTPSTILISRFSRRFSLEKKELQTPV